MGSTCVFFKTFDIRRFFGQILVFQRPVKYVIVLIILSQAIIRVWKLENYKLCIVNIFFANRILILLLIEISCHV
jgi:hypothetical protein